MMRMHLRQRVPQHRQTGLMVAAHHREIASHADACRFVRNQRTVARVADELLYAFLGVFPISVPEID